MKLLSILIIPVFRKSKELRISRRDYRERAEDKNIFAIACNSEWNPPVLPSALCGSLFARSCIWRPLEPSSRPAGPWLKSEPVRFPIAGATITFVLLDMHIRQPRDVPLFSPSCANFFLLFSAPRFRTGRIFFSRGLKEVAPRSLRQKENIYFCRLKR